MGCHNARTAKKAAPHAAHNHPHKQGHHNKMPLIVKPTPAHPEPPAHKIMPAFATRFGPKLAGEVAATDRLVRVNALTALCDALSDPEQAHGCADAGVVETLNAHVSGGQDAPTRVLAAKALCGCARDARAARAMVDAATPAAIQGACLNDAEQDVRMHCYDALIRLGGGPRRGASSIVAAGYPKALVEKAEKESVGLQPRALDLLTSTLGNEQGLAEALDAGGIATCLSLLGSMEAAVRAAAGRCLAGLCFDMSAKDAAVEADAVDTLCALLEDPDLGARRAACAALVSVTTTDEGKRRMVPAEPRPRDAVAAIIALLAEPDAYLTTTACKLVANVAVHPKVRAQLREDKECLPAIDALIAGPGTDQDALIAQHARIAKDAVLWEP